MILGCKVFKIRQPTVFGPHQRFNTKSDLYWNTLDLWSGDVNFGKNEQELFEEIMTKKLPTGVENGAWAAQAEIALAQIKLTKEDKFSEKLDQALSIIKEIKENSLRDESGTSITITFDRTGIDLEFGGRFYQLEAKEIK